jgi:hypothetical protein
MEAAKVTAAMAAIAVLRIVDMALFLLVCICGAPWGVSFSSDDANMTGM